MNRSLKDKVVSYILYATLLAVIALTLLALFTEVELSFDLMELLLGLSLFLQAILNWERRRTASILCVMCAVALWAFTLVNCLR